MTAALGSVLIKQLREIGGYGSQHRMAQHLGVTRQTVSKWETGQQFQPYLPLYLFLHAHCVVPSGYDEERRRLIALHREAFPPNDRYWLISAKS